MNAPAAPAEPLLRVHGLRKCYRDAATPVVVLRDVDLELRRGEAVSLMGVSGSGKSTLLALLAGLLVPDAGSIRFDGRETTTLDDTGRAELRGGRIGVVLQRNNLVPFLSARENVELALELAPGGRRAAANGAAAKYTAKGAAKNVAKNVAMELLAALGVADRADHRPRSLSGGEAQRVAVAVALANAPDLLLADEATGELDGASAERVMALLFGARRERGLAMLYVTHDPDLASRAERTLQLTDGRLLE